MEGIEMAYKIPTSRRRFKKLDVTIEEEPPDRFKKKIYDLEQLEVSQNVANASSWLDRMEGFRFVVPSFPNSHGFQQSWGTPIENELTLSLFYDPRDKLSPGMEGGSQGRITR